MAFEKTKRRLLWSLKLEMHQFGRLSILIAVDIVVAVVADAGEMDDKTTNAPTVKWTITLPKRTERENMLRRTTLLCRRTKR
jgi:hypothetical protein